MKKILLCFAIMGFTFQLSAQENVLSAGNESESSNGKVTYSVGLIHFKEATGTGGSSSTGTQIPFEVSEVLKVEAFKNLVTKVFPNPTDNFLNIHLNSVDNLEYQLIDLSGRKVTSGELNKLESKIELSSLETSIYILNIMKNNSIISSYKISKK
ncbi:T9SS type A sorting domain-containing protein [Winogradskyella sp.]|uniref:T9SS type A sorting domain-containing protein n=1 Tax=Winogradskyella sp. TaxID=1883156 RepID=UPI0025F59940|nr:T9SS type A sorting domain-containing protein [Winogradskyella sp.]MCT4628505.1 T9SS type A sorting domain-containing protein [Winogradskyella sp.]